MMADITPEVSLTGRITPEVSIGGRVTVPEVVYLQGLQGEKGEPGPKGDTGPQGEKGEKGDAFTYADFTGEQLAALKGPRGDTGAKGDKGDRGPQGEQGKPGEPGTPGADGHTPVITAEKTGKVTTIKVDGVAVATVSDGVVSTVNSKTPDASGNVALTGGDIPMSADDSTTLSAAVAGKLSSAAGAVGTDNLSEGAVDTQKLADGSVTRAKLAEAAKSKEIYYYGSPGTPLYIDASFNNKLVWLYYSADAAYEVIFDSEHFANMPLGFNVEIYNGAGSAKLTWSGVNVYFTPPITSIRADSTTANGAFDFRGIDKVSVLKPLGEALIMSTNLPAEGTVLSNPYFVGTPSAPTADVATNSIQIATTEFVHNVIANKSIHGIYAGTGTPAASLGDNGDIYLKYT